ncbi:MAG: hypothetical protein A4E47_00979 [Methanosaeta sp. PtaU1.Bin028]|nr:MAG: hypothetical protein A4E47_00979 [Methanosaeta sp. PtaU1.Bin028]
MKNYILFSVLFAILIGTGLAENADLGDVDAFRQALEHDGFIVQEGELGVFDLIKIYNEGLIPSAYGNNPSTRYIAYFIPPAPGENVDQLGYTIARILGKSGNATPLIMKLRLDEAIVFVGRTPPECRYFSYDANLMFSEFGDEIRWIWISLGDPVNNLVIKTTGTPDGMAGNPFNQTAVIITTADEGIDRRIRAAARSAGYSDNITNTQVIPSTILHMGSTNNSDIFSIYIRPALFRDQVAGDAYLADIPATVLRITPKEPAKVEPYDVPDLRIRGTGKTEFDLMDDLNELRQAILTKYEGLKATQLPTSIWVPEGYDSLQRGINAWGPNRDACYLWTANQTVSSPTPPFCNISQLYDFMRDSEVTLGNDSDEFIIVYGVNHVASGKAAYSNIAVYGAEIWNGVGAINDLEFSGTAEEYLPDNPNARYLYVYKISRNCSGDTHCFEVPTGPGAYGIALDQPLFISWRSYMETASKAGPSYSEIVYDRAIKFDPKD